MGLGYSETAAELARQQADSRSGGRGIEPIVLGTLLAAHGRNAR